VTVKTVNLDDPLIAATEQRARELSEEYGITVSFSEVVRRALTAFCLPVRSINRPMTHQEIDRPADVSA
jgi:hypothetical protein